MTREDTVRVGLLGVGTVGRALLDLVEGRPRFHITKALVRDLDKPRGVARPERILTTDPAAATADVDLVVEAMGGTGLAADLMLSALERGLPVVTANKAALAVRWDEFAPWIRAGRVHFEAAVLAGTPVVGPLAGSLRGSFPRELHALLNGTCTYILAQLEAGRGYDEALREAQRLGYAEADPTLDVEGIDAAHKLALLARMAFDPDLPWSAVAADTVGISHLTPAIVREAMEDGGRVRLVASIVPQEGKWRARVRPVYLPPGHPLASEAVTRGGLLFRGDAVGEVLLAGPGAGGPETASAMLGDLIAAADGVPGPTPVPIAMPVPDHEAEDLGELERA